MQACSTTPGAAWLSLLYFKCPMHSIPQKGLVLFQITSYRVSSVHTISGLVLRRAAMGPLAVTPGALAKIAEGALEEGQRCTLQVHCRSHAPPPASPPSLHIATLHAVLASILHRCCTLTRMSTSGRYGTFSPWSARLIAFGYG